MRFKISPVLNIQIYFKGAHIMLIEVRKLVESLYIDNPKKIQEALKVLLEAPPADGEDYVIVAIKEAIDAGRLSPKSDATTTISATIAEMSPHRDLLVAIGNGINNPVIRQNPSWINDIIFKDTGIKPEARQAFWDCIDKVQEVKALFAGARYSSAIDERCVPTPADPDPKPSSPTIDELCDDEPDSADTVDAYGYAYVSSTPTVDELCGDESCDEPGDSQHRPDPVPSDWKIDDTCTGSNTTSADSGDTTSTAGAPPDANTDVLPEDAVNDEWPPKGDQGKFYSEGREVYFI